MGQEVMTEFHRWFLVGCFGGYLLPSGGGCYVFLLDTSSHVGEDVMPSNELQVIVGDFISGIVILGFCDGIVLGFFGGDTLSSSEFYELYFPQSR